MAEAATLSPPPAAPAASPPPAAPSSSPPITVTPAAVDKGPQAPPPKPGSARERMFQDLRKKSEGNETETRPPATPKETTPAETTTETGAEPTTETPETTTTTAETATTPDPKKGKVSPWKLMEEHKAARLKAEAEVAELRKSIVAPEKLKELETKAEAAERRAKELDEEIKFHDYRKSSEFQEKYQKPYEDAWKRHMSELGELTVPDPNTGSERPIAPQDLLELVNLPLKDAKAAADEKFGDFSNEVMAARKEIRSLFESQNKALEDARKSGGERATQMQAQQQQLNKQIGELWSKANESAVADEKVGKFFKPVEGDEEGNNRLKKGYEIADRAFSLSPTDPRLTPEQRQEVVQLHAAVRNRSAAFGRLTYQNEQLSAKVASLEAEIAKYKGAEPGAGEGKGAAAEQQHSSAKDAVLSGLRKYVH